MIFLKAGIASQEVLLGPFVDATDGNTAESGLTIANTDIKIHKAGATTLENKNSGGATHISDGLYYAVFDSVDTDTPGSGSIIVRVAGALVVRLDFCVLQANVYEALIAGTEWLEVTSLANRVSPSGADLSVYKRDDTTVQFTNTGTFTTGADPLTALAGKP
jgi:hypothetical protein